MPNRRSDHEASRTTETTEPTEAEERSELPPPDTKPILPDVPDGVEVAICPRLNTWAGGQRDYTASPVLDKCARCDERIVRSALNSVKYKLCVQCAEETGLIPVMQAD